MGRQMGKSRNRLLRSGAGVVLAASLAFGGLAGGASGAAAEGWQLIDYRELWQSPATGNSFYEARIESASGMEREYVYRDSAGGWHRLDDHVIGMGMSSGNEYPSVSYDWATVEERLEAFWRYSTYLDDAKWRVVVGHNYALSPDGKWGLLDGGYNLEKSGRPTYSYFLKNIRTGQVTEWQRSDRRLSWAWLPDGRLLVQRFNSEEQQNEIAVYLPAEDRWQRLVLGSIYGYKAEKGLLVFARNEPTRKQWVYDLRTGAIRAYDSAKDDAWLMTGGASAEEPDREGFPEDPDSLPVTALTVARLNEHVVATSEGTVSVPFAFAGAGKTYIPLRPLLGKFGLDWAFRSEKDAAADPQAANFPYSLSRNGTSVGLDEGNSRVLQDRLYVTPEALKSLGLTVLSVTAAETYE
ncbi:hypothetical protein [Cohnella fermenti]|uniref:Copper amine oxidase-like N-terminal domain-containing protein n=1 Tax=Cohnella fermenti TaxID=2565925 RepID=A0A4S4C7W8_9BACL|nr:hypothetical protein [Cohnella fermenti]THF84083.1 hypothetical protein E6C55_01895 [Cohnella fermenti]